MYVLECNEDAIPRYNVSNAVKEECDFMIVQMEYPKSPKNSERVMFDNKNHHLGPFSTENYAFLVEIIS